GRSGARPQAFLSPVFVAYDGRVAARAAAPLTPFPKTSRADTGLGSSRPLPPRSAGSGTPAYLARFHVENLAGRADVDEGSRLRPGHPELRAELGEFIEQRLAPVGIEMRDHFVEQQQRHD